MKYLTVCRLTKSDGSPCGQQFTANALPDQVSDDKQARAFVQGLLKHIEQKHPEAFAEIQQRWILMLGFLTLRCFESQDPGVGRQLEGFTKFLYSIAYQPPEVQKSA
jgi:hypothetical protein